MSYLDPIASQSQPAYEDFSNRSPAMLEAIRAKEEEAAAFTEAEILHKSNLQMDAAVRKNTKSLLADVGLKLSAQV
ncbi:MAG: hypothetical protein OXU45_02620 [Candidatus Melainabacteria bacterium]|nr:hypothetical protein [Candidatus Melainabacteria bacterium]